MLFLFYELLNGQCLIPFDLSVFSVFVCVIINTLQLLLTSGEFFFKIRSPQC